MVSVSFMGHTSVDRLIKRKNALRAKNGKPTKRFSSVKSQRNPFGTSALIRPLPQGAKGYPFAHRGKVPSSQRMKVMQNFETPTMSRAMTTSLSGQMISSSWRVAKAVTAPRDTIMMGKKDARMSLAKMEPAAPNQQQRNPQPFRIDLHADDVHDGPPRWVATSNVPALTLVQ